MSRNEWEAGEIVLPTGEFARVRQAVSDSVRGEKESVYEAGQQFWGGLTPKQKRGGHDYVLALENFMRANPTLPDAFAEAAQPDWGEPAKRITRDSIDFPTARTLVFRAGTEGRIIFDRGRPSVSWSSGDNNRAVERAHDTISAGVLFRALGQVKWTRGTGGVLSGNDEYNQDSREDGYGANYATAGFGPRGAVRAPGHTDAFDMADGSRVTRVDFPRLQKAAVAAARRTFGHPGHRPAHSPGGTGGQFAARWNSDPEARL